MPGQSQVSWSNPSFKVRNRGHCEPGSKENPTAKQNWKQGEDKGAVKSVFCPPCGGLLSRTEIKQGTDHVYSGLSSNSSDFRRIKSLVFLYNGVYLYSLAKRENRNALSLFICFLQNSCFSFLWNKAWESSASWVALVIGAISTLKVSFTAQVSAKWLVRQSQIIYVYVNDCKQQVNKCCHEPLVAWGRQPTLCSAGSTLLHLAHCRDCPLMTCHLRVCATPLHLPPHFADGGKFSQTMLKWKGEHGDVDTLCVCVFATLKLVRSWEHVESRHGPTRRWGGHVSAVKGPWLTADLTESDLVVLLCWETILVRFGSLFKHNENRFYNLHY